MKYILRYEQQNWATTDDDADDDGDDAEYYD